MGTLAFLIGASTVFLFKYPSAAVFGLWCGLVATEVGAYHFLNVRDSKENDACRPS